MKLWSSGTPMICHLEVGDPGKPTVNSQFKVRGLRTRVAWRSCWCKFWTSEIPEAEALMFEGRVRWMGQTKKTERIALFSLCVQWIGWFLPTLVMVNLLYSPTTNDEKIQKCPHTHTNYLVIS
jgi:hypothetical protein